MFRLLIVEDNPAEAALMRDLLKTLRRPHELYFAADGLDALDFLHCRGAYADAPRPNLILLDVQMPRMNGHDFLTSIKNDPQFSVIPVIMLSTSIRPEDISRAYQAHANCYVQKPNSLERAEKLIRAIEAFWIDVAILPPCDEQPKPRALQTA